AVNKCCGLYTARHRWVSKRCKAIGVAGLMAYGLSTGSIKTPLNAMTKAASCVLRQRLMNREISVAFARGRKILAALGAGANCARSVSDFRRRSEVSRKATARYLTALAAVHVQTLLAEQSRASLPADTVRRTPLPSTESTGGGRR